jgi:hypothetical protein
MRRLFTAALFAVANAAFAQGMPFIPQLSVNVAVTGTAQTLAVPQITNPGPLWQYVVTSTASPLTGCTQPSFFTVDGTTVATVGNGMPILPNSAFLISVPKAITSWSVIGADVGCTFYVTVGVGQ